MKKHLIRGILALSLCLALLAGSAMASARMEAAAGTSALFSAAIDTAAAADGESADGRMVIREAGEYTLTGSLRGTVYVDPGEGEVLLILDNVTIDGGASAGIIAVSGDRLTIRTAAGSVNSVSDGGADGTYDAAICSDVDLVFEGDGLLDITGRNRMGIRVNGADLAFNGGLVRIVAPGDGITARNIAVNGGSVYVCAGGSAVESGAILSVNGGEFHGDWTGPEAATAQVSPVYAPADAASAGDAADSVPSDDSEAAASEEPALPSDEPAFDASDELPADPGDGQTTGDRQPAAPGASGELQGGSAVQSTVSVPGQVVTGVTENSAMALQADYDSAITYTVTDEDGNVTISQSGTYIVTGSSSNGSITVKKGTTGVVLVLEDLDLTSTGSATLSINKQAEVQVIVSGSVTLTDGENPEDEYSEDADVADAFDGAAIKVKAESVVFITGDGTLTINGDAKNGIKGGDDSSIILGGDVEIDITAANDGINSNYDVTILSGTVTVSAGDDGIHADHILTIGDEASGTGPDLTIQESVEGLEGTVINIYGGDIDVTASDDGINAANGDGVYEGELDYSLNVMGGDITVSSGGDGVDSNGDVNLIGGSMVIHSQNAGGEAGIDYDADLYISDDFDLNNEGGLAGPDGGGVLPGQGTAPAAGSPGAMPAGASREMGG